MPDMTRAPRKPQWTGGAKWNKFKREAKRTAERPPVIEVGFKGRHIAALAAGHEYGIPSANVPERPAFRLGVDRMRKVVLDRIVEMKRADARAARGAVFGLTQVQAEEIAILARDVLRDAYHDFHGQPLSEKQKARKAGTPYADDQLVGSEGPKLINHIKAFVGGREVG